MTTTAARHQSTSSTKQDAPHRVLGGMASGLMVQALGTITMIVGSA